MAAALAPSSISPLVSFASIIVPNTHIIHFYTEYCSNDHALACAMSFTINRWGYKLAQALFGSMLLIVYAAKS